MNEKEWTIMIYMAGDNNLAVDMSYAIEQIKSVAGNDPASPNLFVYYDGNSAAIPTLYCDFSDPGNPLYQPSYQRPDKLYPTGDSKRNEDASDYYSLINFVDWCVNRVEVKNGDGEVSVGRRANRYALIISGHSAGFLDKGLFKDETAEKSMSMTYLYDLFSRLTDTKECLIENAEKLNEDLKNQNEPELNPEEYKQDTTVLLGQRFSILGFDSCVMGMLEVAFQFSPFADTLIASEGIVPEAGWTYGKILGCLAQDNNLATKKVAEKFVTGFIESQDAYKIGGVSVDMAAWDFTPETKSNGDIWYPAIDNLIEAVNYLSTVLHECFRKKDLIYRQMERILLQVHWKCQSYMFDQNIDLGDFCELLIKECQSFIKDFKESLSEDDRKFLKSIVEHCQNVLESLKKFVIISGYSGGKYQYSNGVSLFFPWTYETFEVVRKNYEDLWFYKSLTTELRKSSWLSFLDLYLGEVCRRGSEEPEKPKQRYPWAGFDEDSFSQNPASIVAGISGKLGTGQGKLGTGQGKLGTGQGKLGTGQGKLGTGQGKLTVKGSNAFIDSLETFKNVYTPWNISGFSKEIDNG